MRIEPEKAYQVVRLLTEGMGVRACERLTRLNRRTVLGVLEMAGRKCQQISDEKLRNLNCKFVQADEMYGFVYSLQQNTDEANEWRHGTFYTHLSICRDSKLVINSHIGKRTRQDTDTFIRDLKGRIPNRFQFTTDGWKTYTGSDGAVSTAFGENIDYATEVKYFAKPDGNIFQKQRLCSVSRRRRIGHPDMRKATTCHMERTNLSVRLFNRRHTRLTLGYSKNCKTSNSRFTCSRRILISAGCIPA